MKAAEMLLGTRSSLYFTTVAFPLSKSQLVQKLLLHHRGNLLFCFYIQKRTVFSKQNDSKCFQKCQKWNFDGGFRHHLRSFST
jgi:hypothetical protein